MRYRRPERPLRAFSYLQSAAIRNSVFFIDDQTKTASRKKMRGLNKAEATIVVGDSLVVFSNVSNKVEVSKYDNLKDIANLRLVELPHLPGPQGLWRYALSLVKGKYVMVTGGCGNPSYNGERSSFGSVFMLNAKTEQWVTEPSLPNLKTARQWHSSCAIDWTVYIYGGKSEGKGQFLGSIEWLSVE